MYFFCQDDFLIPALTAFEKNLSFFVSFFHEKQTVHTCDVVDYVHRFKCMVSNYSTKMYITISWDYFIKEKEHKIEQNVCGFFLKNCNSTY